MGRGHGWERDSLRVPFSCGETTGQQADGSGFHISFAARDLAREAPAGVRLQTQCFIEQPWRIEKCVAMQPAKPGKFGAFQPWNAAKDADLLTMSELGLKPDHVE